MKMKSFTKKLAISALTLLLFNGVVSAQLVFVEDFSTGISGWIPGVERLDALSNPPFVDMPNPPTAALGGAMLSSQSSCGPPGPFDGVATTLTKTIFLPAGIYSLRHLVSHSTELFAFCQGSTHGSSEVLVDGVVVTSVFCRQGDPDRSILDCGVCEIPLSEQAGCFEVLVDGNVELKLRTDGGDCARVVGFFDDIKIFEDCCNPVEPDVHTVGFWKRVCKEPHPFGEHDNLFGYINCVNTTDTFADVDSVDDLCDRLNPNRRNDKCEQAEAQFMALLLNVCSGRVATCNCVLDPDLGETTVGEVIELIDVLLSNADRSFDDCALSQSLADLINNGLILVPCP